MSELAPQDTAPPFVVGLRTSLFNWRMRRAREDRGLTQAQLGDLVGVSAATVGQAERLDRDYGPSWDVLDRIAGVLEEDLATLFPAWLRTKALKNLGSVQMPMLLTEQDATESDAMMGAVLQDQLRQRIEQALATLSHRERVVLELRFGLSGNEAHTLKEAGRQLGVTIERIRQIENKALRKLRHHSRSRPLAEFIEPSGPYDLASSSCQGSGEKPTTKTAVGHALWGVCEKCGLEVRLEGGMLPEHWARRD